MGYLNYVRQAVKAYTWKYEGEMSVEGSALTTDKSAATAHALTSTTFVRIQPNENTVSLELRFRVNGTANLDDVVNLYAMAGNSDHYTLMGTLTLTAGTQTDGTYLFCDGIEIANELWIDDIVTLHDEGSAGNGIGRVCFNTQGYNNFLLVVTDLDNTAIRVDSRRI